MMKISKPVLTNDFLLSPVQFTSLNSILFKNVKNIYDGNEKISLEYEHSPKIEASTRDWIGIFPRGWSTLQQYVTFEWVSQSLPSSNSEQNKENGDLIRRTINFCPKYHINAVNNNSFYQFVYVSKQIEVLGVSSYFRFDVMSTKDSALELECLVPVSGKLRSTSVSDFGVTLGKNFSSTTSIGGKTVQTSSIHSMHNLEVEGKNWTKPQGQMNTPEVKKPTIFARKPHLTSGTGDALDPYSSHSEPVFPMSLQMSQCKKCFHFKRGGEFVRSQQVLQSKVGQRNEDDSEPNDRRRTIALIQYLSQDKLKIVMERNKVLEERAQEMKKEMERIQTESKKLKMSFYNVNKEKVAYEKFVKDFIKSLEKDSIVRVVNGNTEILVKKVNYVGMEEHPRDKKTSKRERELKAVIGLQEITIRNLINSLQEKAKSVQELNQTVKLAQAFSAAREDNREYGSDAEDTSDDVSNSDVASEYEFSLTKPQPPEEAIVEDADAVLNDIRRTTEMELKDIGINRSLGKSSSRETELESGVPNISVRSYQNPNEGTRPKKPRLFDNVEDCWPFTDNSAKTIHRKVIEACHGDELDEKDGNDHEEIEEEEEVVINDTNENEYQNNPNQTEIESNQYEKESSKNQKGMSNDYNIEIDQNYEDYYDAYEISNAKLTQEEVKTIAGKENKEISSTMQTDDLKKDKKNFLVTAIIPQDMDIKSQKNSEDWPKSAREETTERENEPVPEKRKKFTCEFSIDFRGKKNQSQERTESSSQQRAIEDGHGENCQNQANENYEIVPKESQPKREKSFMTFKQSNKCLEIQITQMDKKEAVNKSCVHQKMVVKFGKDGEQVKDSSSKSPKFEINLEVSGLGDSAKLIKSENNQLPEPKEVKQIVDAKEPVELEEVKVVTDFKESKHTFKHLQNEDFNDLDGTPRTIWNDATEDILEEDEDEVEETSAIEQKNIEIPQTEKLEIEAPTAEDDAKDDSDGNISSRSCKDSFRYEKNMEFLQQKGEDKLKEEEEVTKDKPTAILIQSGQTKLALIRYQ